MYNRWNYLVSVASEMHAVPIIWRLSIHYEGRMCENQTGFSPDRGHMNLIFTMRLSFNCRHTLCWSKIGILLDLKVAFFSINVAIILRTLQLTGMQHDFTSIFLSLYEQRLGRARDLDDLTPEFTWRSGVRPSYPHVSIARNIYSDSNLHDLGYAKDIVLLNENTKITSIS